MFFFAAADMAGIILVNKLQKCSIKYECFLLRLLPTLFVNVFRKQRTQRAQNATSATVATSTAGTLSAATPFHRHDTAGRIHSTAWTRSAHVHVRPRRQTSWSPVAAAMVWNCNVDLMCVFHMLLAPSADSCEKVLILHLSELERYRWMIMVCVFNVVAVVLLFLLHDNAHFSLFKNSKWSQFKASIKIKLSIVSF